VRVAIGYRIYYFKKRMGSAGFEPATSSAQGSRDLLKIDSFEAYLRKALTNEKDVTYILAAALKYQDVLTTGKAGKLLSLTDNVRRQAMRALSHLARYNGVYQQWRMIIQQHGLRWRKTEDRFDFFEKEDFNEMIEYIKQTVKILPKHQANTFILATLLGLRADETCKAISLLKQDSQGYYNCELGILEHYKFKQVFIRRTKKAYISLVDQETLDLARQSCESYQAIRSYLKRRKQPMMLKYARKIFGTWLRQNGVESEFVDILQGRTPASVFARHYYRPDFDKNAVKVKRLIAELREKITDVSI
jgi:intergrase/recombinase